MHNHCECMPPLATSERLHCGKGGQVASSNDAAARATSYGLALRSRVIVTAATTSKAQQKSIMPVRAMAAA
jgi:hypothetical protein